jgi:TRAP-type C4-dicarboxylate transport system permease small subunit
MKKKNKTQKNNFFSLSKLDKVVFKIEEYLIIFFTSVALLTGCLQVIFRYVFNWGVTWSETAFVISTIVAMFIAGSRAIRDDQHISVDVFVLLFRKKIQNF